MDNEKIINEDNSDSGEEIRMSNFSMIISGKIIWQLLASNKETNIKETMNLKLLSFEINVLFDECNEPRMRLVRSRDFVDTLDMNMTKKV